MEDCLDASGYRAPDARDPGLADSGLRPWDGGVGLAGGLDAAVGPVVATGSGVEQAMGEATGGAAATPAEPAATPVPQVPPAPDEWVTLDDLSFYLCSYDGLPVGYDAGYCGAMANGEIVHDGAIACGYGFALGTRLSIVGDPSGRVGTCKDRGLGAWLWVDWWFYSYAEGRQWRDGIPPWPWQVRIVP